MANRRLFCAVVFGCAGAGVLLLAVGLLVKDAGQLKPEVAGARSDPTRAPGLPEVTLSMNELAHTSMAFVEAKPTPVLAGQANTSLATTSSEVESFSPLSGQSLQSGVAASKCAGGGSMIPDSGRGDGLRCKTFFDSIEDDLAKWQGRKIRLFSSWARAKLSGPVKLALINWDGIGRVSLYTRDVRYTKLSFTKPHTYAVAAKLVADLARRVRLPPVEFLFTPMDKCPLLANSVPVFVLAKNNTGRGILFPSIVRLDRPRLESGLATWGYEFLPAVPWEQKKTDVFYRGSSVGIEDRGTNYQKEPKVDICCMGRVTKKPRCPVNVGLTCSSHEIHPYCKSCGAHRTPYPTAAQHKFLAIPPGTGYTGRFKDYLAFESVSIKRYKYHLVEFFERGMVHGHNGHLLDVSGESHGAFLDAVNWAYTHDAISKKIGQRGAAYVKWALSDETILCFVWKLLTSLSRLLNYSYELSAFAKIAKGVKGVPLEKALRIPQEGHYRHYETNVVPPSEEDHLKFVRQCESLEIPREAQPS